MGKLFHSYDCSWRLWISSSFRKEKIIHIVNAIIQNESSALRKSALLKVKHCEKINKVACEKFPALVRQNECDVSWTRCLRLNLCIYIRRFQRSTSDQQFLFFFVFITNKWSKLFNYVGQMLKYTKFLKKTFSNMMQVWEFQPTSFGLCRKTRSLAKVCLVLSSKSVYRSAQLFKLFDSQLNNLLTFSCSCVQYGLGARLFSLFER